MDITFFAFVLSVQQLMVPVLFMQTTNLMLTIQFTVELLTGHLTEGT